MKWKVAFRPQPAGQPQTQRNHLVSPAVSELVGRLAARFAPIQPNRVLKEHRTIRSARDGFLELRQAEGLGLDVFVARRPPLPASR